MTQAPRNWLAIAGPLLGLLGVTGYFAVVFLAGAWLPTVRDTAWPNLLLVAAGLGCSALVVRRARGGAGRGPRLRGATALAATNVGLGGAFLWLLYGMSAVPSAEGPPVGMIADAGLTGPDGSPVRLSDLRGRPLLLVFYRGHW